MLQVKRVVASSKLRENFKHSVKVANNHAYLKNVIDEDTSVLKTEECKPSQWLKQPSPSEISKFVEKSEEYAKMAKKVRTKLLSNWWTEYFCNEKFLVEKFNTLRNSNPDSNIWPCPRCDKLSMYLYLKIK